MNIKEVCEYIAENGGATIKYKGRGEYEIVKRKRGYAVSLYGYEKTYLYITFDCINIVISKYVNDNAEMLKNKGYYVGVWIDNGVIYLDITIIINNKVKALLRAKLEKQQAIYDFNTCKTLYLNDYKHLITNVVLYERVDKLEVIDELKPISVLYSKQLNKCYARSITYITNYGFIHVYFSYNTIVFIQINDNLYFNRLNYSSTTTQHIHKFIKKYELKVFEWYQLIRSEWYRLIKQLKIYTEYGPNYDYSDNNCNWLYDIDKIIK